VLFKWLIRKRNNEQIKKNQIESNQIVDEINKKRFNFNILIVE